MALKVVLALALVALAASDDGYNYNAPVRSFSHRAASSESSEEDGGYNYQAPTRTFTHKPRNTYVAPAKPVVKYVAPVDESSEEDGYNYQQPARTFTHNTPVRVAVRPRKTYVAPAKPVVKYVAPVDVSSEEDGYNYQQPTRTFSHSPPTRVAAPKPKSVYVAPKPKSVYVAPKPKNVYVAPTQAPKPRNTYQAPKPRNTYQAPANTYKAPESDEVLDYEPLSPEYNTRYEVTDDETGAEFRQEEERDGDQTRGSYSVDLPDGRRQTVTYYVNGDGGFVAEVTYEGEAEFPPAPEGGYGPWTGPIAGSSSVRAEYSAPAQTYAAPDSSEEVARPRGLYNAPRA